MMPLQSNVTGATYANGVQSSMTYDALNRISGLSTPSTSFSYSRGATGNLTGATEGNGRTLSWTYDGIYRLTNETISGDPTHNNGSSSYSLDPVGNRLSESTNMPGMDSGSFGYNADDEVSTETYDNNGNTLATGGKTFAYDAENHLTSMNSGTVTLIYDGDGNRVSKTVGGVTTQYLVDGMNPTGYAQVVEEVVGGAVARQYTYGLQRISENQVIENVWTPSFYGYDGGGNVRNLTNTAGTITDDYEYDAFGNAFTKVGTTPNNYLYRGEQYDSDLGLYYLRARYYNPATGRFMSRDPEDGYTNDPASLHKYLYVGGDPVNALDPMGRDIVEYNAANRRLGFQLHHIVEQRFGRLFGGAVCSLAAVLTVVEHQAITNAWRRAIPYGIAGTGLATIEQVFAVAEQIYANSPEMAAALQECKALAGL